MDFSISSTAFTNWKNEQENTRKYYKLTIELLPFFLVCLSCTPLPRLEIVVAVFIFLFCCTFRSWNMSYSLGPLKTRGNHLLLYLVIRLILQVHGLCNQFFNITWWRRASWGKGDLILKEHEKCYCYFRKSPLNHHSSWSNIPACSMVRSTYNWSCPDKQNIDSAKNNGAFNKSEAAWHSYHRFKM